MRTPAPALKCLNTRGIRVWHDPELLADRGVIVAFSERGGGVSETPFRSLNLAAHVGDDPTAVDENRSRLLRALGLQTMRESLTVPEQVHGQRIALVDRETRGSGAFAAGGPPPVGGADALLTRVPGVPLLLCFADCVPVTLVAPGPYVAVVHAGWKGAIASLPGLVARRLVKLSGADASEIVAYIGPHIRGCHYQVGEDLMSQFVNKFGSLARADSGGLDLDAVVTASLTDAGVATCRIARLGACTAETTDRFYSFRAESGLTGRHSAIACILPSV